MSGVLGAAVPGVEEYAAAVRRGVMRLLRSQRGLSPFDVDDIAQDTILRFMEDPVAVMAAYAEPWLYARASMQSRMVDFGRRERSQRGEGARLVETSDGKRPRRIAVSLGQGDEGRTPDWIVADPRRLDERVLDSIEIERILSMLSVRERQLLLGVDGYDFTVVEVAEMLGLTRETCSRLLNRTRRLVRQAVVSVHDAVPDMEPAT